MTNKEAIKILENLIGDTGNEVILNTLDCEALTLAIESLSKLSKKRTCPVDDQECHEAIDFDCKDCAIKKLNDFLLN